MATEKLCFDDGAHGNPVREKLDNLQGSRTELFVFINGLSRTAY